MPGNKCISEYTNFGKAAALALKKPTASLRKLRITGMKILLDKILQEVVDQAYGYARLGRATEFTVQEGLFAEVLAELEADGDAMRYLNSKGRIAWKATPQLRDYLTDLQLDAEADFANEEI
jgi:hypothetical protein